MTPVFLGEKRLIVLDGIPRPSGRTDEEEGEKTSERDVESIILDVLDRIPETTVVVFAESEPDKRRALYKELMSHATIKDYPTLEGGNLRDYVRRRLPHIDISAASLLIEYVAGDMGRIESEIEKLALFKQEDWITESDIREHIVPNLETSIFGLTDALVELDSAKSHREFIRILETNNIHQVFSTIMSTLRTFLYVCKLTELRYGADEVKAALKVHPFVYDKMKKRLSAHARIASLFGELVTLDRRTKT